MKILPRTFYNRKTQIVAQELLGKYLIMKEGLNEKIGKIVEVEAYLGEHDLACHSAKGRTARTEVMFGHPGYAYIYMIYGMYYCTNVVTESEGDPCAVLLRALEPVKGIDKKTQGPGLLSIAMGINKKFNGADLTREPFFIAEEKNPEKFDIVARPRIGVDYAGDWAKEKLRFYIKDNAFVSKNKLKSNVLKIIF